MLYYVCISNIMYYVILSFTKYSYFYYLPNSINVSNLTPVNKQLYKKTKMY